MDDILLDTEEYILKAKEHMACWEYIQARRILIELLEDEPDHARAHQLLGCIYASQLNMYETAQKHFNHAIHFDAAHGSVYCDYIYLLKVMRRYKSMIQLAIKAEKVEGVNLAYILYYKAEAFEMLQEYVNALMTYSESMILETNSDRITKCELSISRIEKKIKVKEQLDQLSRITMA